MLLVNRSDGYGWGLPGGFCEVYEGPEETTVREVREETGIEVRVEAFIQIFQRLAGGFGIPFTTYSMLYHCSLVSGDPSTSLEAKEVGFYDIDTIPEKAWFMNFHHRCQVARAFWRAL